MRIRDFFSKLYGEQVIFYEIQVTYGRLRATLPPTYFVTFTNFRTTIDWSQSKSRKESPTIPNQPFDSFYLFARPQEMIFARQSGAEKKIWIEKNVKSEGVLYACPNSVVFTTNEEAELIDRTFPELFIIEHFREV
jgi:hypothetical protein